MAINLTCTNCPHDGYIEVSTNPDTEYPGVGLILIRHKIKSELLFTSVYMKYTESEDDLTFTFNDILCRNNCTYQIEVHFCSVTGITLDSAVAEVKSNFDVLVVADGIDYWKTPLNVSAINTTLIRPYVMNTPLYAPKPSYYVCTNNSYEEGTCKGIFLKMVKQENGCVEFETQNNWQYRKQLKEFLLMGNSKLIKCVTGDMWLVGIKTDSITDNSLFENAEIEGARQIEFGWFEIGDPDSEEDLYNNGLINVVRRFWSRT